LLSPRFAEEYRAELDRLRAAVNGEGEQEAEQAPPAPFKFLTKEGGDW
jgi:hypothetical protein